MKTSEILIEAKKLIKNPDNWIKHARARTCKYGLNVDPLDQEATCFCAVGSVQKIKNCNADTAYSCTEVKLLSECLPENFHLSSIWSFNDNFKTTHNQIIQVFNKAIKFAIKQESQEKN